VALPIQTIPAQTWQELLQPYLDAPLSDSLRTSLETYLELLLRWNARMNLTAIRTPERVIQRHFGESLFLARHLSPDARTLLDHGSGAGFPGLPIALARPEIAVTLAESHSRKAAFLREAVRALELSNATVHGGRTESLPPDHQFEAVTLRAVDKPLLALETASQRVAPAGYLYWLAGPQKGVNSTELAGFHREAALELPNSSGSALIWRKA
jgi:16S rRNA (guanine527-N7)-methyltransferase